MTPNRKQRSDIGPVKNINGEPRARLVDLLRKNATYQEVVSRLKSEFGITTSKTAVGEFYKKNIESILGPEPFVAVAPAPVLLATIISREAREIRIEVEAMAGAATQTGEANPAADRIEIIVREGLDGDLKLSLTRPSTAEPEIIEFDLTPTAEALQ